ncbi:hypothetical protein TRAPUB_2665 [Trametes pubescens]|uniref:Uncharacterized protein n=1 Tax=Trametes pubescens TaxID=154538 RepID=A0A1M2VG20_TRAPU|nr:hypothetical protein TRAPUB_2665 [Trametes pubescens]
MSVSPLPATKTASVLSDPIFVGSASAVSVDLDASVVSVGTSNRQLIWRQNRLSKG